MSLDVFFFSPSSKCDKTLQTRIDSLIGDTLENESEGKSSGNTEEVHGHRPR